MMVSGFEVRGVTKVFGNATSGHTVLKQISCVFEQGKKYAIAGVSGSGKSTLLHMLVGIEPVTDGHILYNGCGLNAFTHNERRAFLHKDIGLVFQDPYLINELTVLENVMIKSLIMGCADTSVEDEARALLVECGLVDLAHRYPSQLSGGQAQRVAVVRALCGKPSFLIMDEPTAHLDEVTTYKILDLLDVYCKKTGSGLIISTHDPVVVNKLPAVYRLHEGSLV